MLICCSYGGRISECSKSSPVKEAYSYTHGRDSVNPPSYGGRIQIRASLTANCIILNKSPYNSVPQFPCLGNGIITFNLKKK